jgi:hypothetical protein
MNGTTVERFGETGFSLSTGLPPWLLKAAVGTGVVVGAAYVLSPLTVVVGLALIPLFRWAGRDIPAAERRWVYGVLAAGVLLRVLAIAGLMVTANHDAGTFAKFFGDEEFYQLRGQRLYNIEMGIPVSMESLLYAYDKTGVSIYQTLLVLIQLLVGPAPYGLHLLNSLLFLFGVVLLYRVVRRSLGAVVAGVGATLLLFFPSLFMWSVSALKESPFLTATALTLVAAVSLPRAKTPGGFASAAIGLVGGSLLCGALRPGGTLLTAAGVGLGYVLWLSSLRRTILFVVAAACVYASVSVVRSGLSPRAETQLEQMASYHRGHVFTSGHYYKLLDDRFYTEYWGPLVKLRMTNPEASRFVVRAIANYVAQPLPWKVASRFELAYMPELFVWYLLAILFPLGCLLAFRRDALLTCVLAGYSLVNVFVIALNSGNIGTLVRHRALVVPYMIWMSATGLIAILEKGAPHGHR